MADNNVEEFTIKYKVDTGAASKNLHEFGEHVKKVKHEGKEGAGSFAELGESFAGAASKALTAGAVIGTVMSGIAKAISSTVQAMKDYNEQLELGKKSGIGYAMQTIISNNMIKANTLLTQSDTKKAMEAVTSYVTKAYTNPNPQNRENQVLSRMGINVFGKDGKPIDTQEAMEKLAEHFKSVSPQQAEAEGRELGLNPDAAASMHDLGKAIVDTSNATLNQVERQQEAAKAAEELHRNLNTFWDDVTKIARVLNDELLGPMAKMAGKISGTVHPLAESFDKEGTAEFTAHMARYMKAKKYTAKDIINYLTNPLGSLTQLPSTPEEKQVWEDTAKKDDEKNKEKKIDKLADEYKEFKGYADPIKVFERSTNQFAQAVAAMPGALSEEEAFAAWAGGVANAVLADAKASSGGNDSGGGGSSRGGRVVTGKALSPEVAAYLAETDRIIGAKPGTSAAQAMVESQGDTSAHSGKGAQGLMQIMPKTQAVLEQRAGRKFDANNPIDSAIMHRMLMKENVNKFGNVEDAQRAYNGGWNPKTWGNAETSAYVGSINATRDGGSGGKVIGRNMEDNRYDMAARTIANSLNMKDPGLLMRGGVGGKDAQYALTQAQNGLGVKVRELQGKLETDVAAHQMNAAKTDIQQLRKAQVDLKALTDYGQQIVDLQKNKEGDTRTRDLPQNLAPLNLTVNISGVSDPHEVVKILGEQVERTIQEQSNKITG